MTSKTGSSDPFSFKHLGKKQGEKVGVQAERRSQSSPAKREEWPQQSAVAELKVSYAVPGNQRSLRSKKRLRSIRLETWTSNSSMGSLALTTIHTILTKVPFAGIDP